MIFKKNNPGCPCCDCPCYKFDDNGRDSSAGKHLTETSAAYDTGRLSNAAEFEGSAHFLRDHDDCFSPSEHETWRMWFWFKEVTRPSDAVGAYHGVVTKALYNGSTGSPPTTASLEGEWGVFYRPLTSGGEGDTGSDLFFVYKSSTTTLGISGTTGIVTGDWYFFHWTINHTSKDQEVKGWNASQDAELTTCPTSGCTETPDLQGNMSKTTTPLRVGNNTGHAGLILGANSGSFLIDNLGFSTKAGSATDLYNSGTGKACPSRGY